MTDQQPAPGSGTSSAPMSGAARAGVAGALLFLVGPLAGSMITAFFIARGFEAVASADPSQKAVLLAERISGAMYFTVAGLGVGVIGAVVAVIGVAGVIRQGRGRG